MLSPREQLLHASNEAREAAQKNKKAFKPFGQKHKARRVFNNEAGWFEIDGKRFYFRSKWERNYARFLAYQVRLGLIKDWDYECETFTFPQTHGTNTYKIDFKVFSNDGAHYYVEVKGYMDAKSLTKIKRMGKYHAGEKLIVCDAPWFRSAAGKALALQVPDWE